jgi:hypothetical protein
MKTLITIAKVTFVATIALYCAGCMSVWSQRSSLDEARRSRILASNNQEAIKALNVGVSPRSAIKAVKIGNGAGIGIDVTSWEALKLHPWRQLGAAAADAGLLYASKEVLDNLNDDGNNSDGGRQNITVNVEGSDDTSVSVTSTGDSTSTDNSNNSDNSDAQDNSM